MYKMHVIDIFMAFYIRKKIVFGNIAKIKGLRIKDGLQYRGTDAASAGVVLKF